MRVPAAMRTGRRKQQAKMVAMAIWLGVMMRRCRSGEFDGPGRRLEERKYNRRPGMGKKPWVSWLDKKCSRVLVKREEGFTFSTPCSPPAREHECS